MSLSILIYGNFDYDLLATSYQRAFEQLGHRVTAFDTRKLKFYLTSWLNNRYMHRLTIKSLQLRRLGSLRWNQHLLQVSKANKPDLFFVLNGEFIMPETLHTLQQQGTRVFIFHADNPFPPFANTRPETLPCALVSDCYLIWSRNLVKRLKSIGVKRAEYLPFAWDPEVFPYAEPDNRFEHDVVFIGGWDKEREAFLTPIAKEFNLKIWGPDYWGTRTEGNSPLRTCWQGRSVRSHEAVEILRRSRIALNIVRQQNLPDGVIMRTFELPGCGVFGLSTRTQGSLELFAEDEYAAYFTSTEECAASIDAYLHQPKTRNKIIQSAHTLVQEKHQYTHRVMQIAKTYYNEQALN